MRTRLIFLYGLWMTMIMVGIFGVEKWMTIRVDIVLDIIIFLIFLSCITMSARIYTIMDRYEGAHECIICGEPTHEMLGYHWLCDEHRARYNSVQLVQGLHAYGHKSWQLLDIAVMSEIQGVDG